MQQQNYKRNRIGWIILALVCLGIGVMVGGRGAAFMNMAQQRGYATTAQQNGPGMWQGRGQQGQQAPGQFQDLQGQQAPGQFQGHGTMMGGGRGEHGMMQGGGRGEHGMMHGPGRGGFLGGIFGLLGNLLKTAAFILAGLFLFRLWQDRNDPNSNRRWPWQRRQEPEPGTTDPPYTGNTSSL